MKTLPNIDNQRLQYWAEPDRQTLAVIAAVKVRFACGQSHTVPGADAAETFS